MFIYYNDILWSIKIIQFVVHCFTCILRRINQCNYYRDDQTQSNLRLFLHVCTYGVQAYKFSVWKEWVDLCNVWEAWKSLSLFFAVVRQFQEYVEPDESTEDRRRSGIKDEDKVLLPLDENVLTDNLGLPMVVVVTKVSMVHVHLRQ